MAPSRAKGLKPVLCRRLADTNHLRKSGPTAGAIPFANMENGPMDDSRDVSGARNGTAKLSLHSNAGMDLFVRCMAANAHGPSSNG